MAESERVPLFKVINCANCKCKLTNLKVNETENRKMPLKVNEFKN